MKSILQLIALCLVLSMTSGCGTINGVGQDVSSVGHGISHAAGG